MKMIFGKIQKIIIFDFILIFVDFGEKMKFEFF